MEAGSLEALVEGNIQKSSSELGSNLTKEGNLFVRNAGRGITCIQPTNHMIPQ